MTTAAEGYDQGAWVYVDPGARKTAGRKDGRASHDFVDVGAFRRLAKMNFDGRPADVPFSNAMWRMALKEDARRKQEKKKEAE